MANQSGNGAFTDGLRRVFNYVKDNKLLSRGLYAASTILPAGWSTAATAAGKLADEAGYDRCVAVVRVPSRVRRIRRRKVVRKVLVGTVMGKGILLKILN